MKLKSQKPLISMAFALACTASLVACAPIGEPNSAELDAQYFTGDSENSKLIQSEDFTGEYYGSGQVNYTVAGNVEQFKSLKEKVLPTIDAELSKKIKNVTIEITHTIQVKITVFIEKSTTENYEFVFSGSLTKINEQKSQALGLVSSLQQNSPIGKLTLDLTCLVETCDSAELLLSTAQGKKVGVLYSTTHPKVSFESNQEQNETRSAGLRELKPMTNSIGEMQSVDSNKISVSVVSGPSFARIEVPSKNLEIMTPLLDTQDERSSVDQVVINGNANPQIQGTLVGNDPATGSVAVDVQAKDTNEKVRIYIEESEIDADLLSEPKLEDPATPTETAPETATPTVSTPETATPKKTPDAPVAPKLPPTTPPTTPPKPAQKSAPQAPIAPTTPPTTTPPVTPATTKPDQSVQPASPTTPKQPPKQTTAPTNPNSSYQMPAEVLNPSAPYSESAIYKGTVDAVKLPNATRAAQAFAAYAKDPETQRMARVWLGYESNSGACARGAYSSSMLINYISRAPKIAEHVRTVTEKLDVTPEIGYLLALESSYLMSDDFAAMDYPKHVRSNIALGPWQIVMDTANNIRRFSGVPFQVLGFTSPGKVNPNDDRTYFKQATYMAALYLKKLFSMFSFDPGVAIMAYHAGEGAAGGAVKSADRAARADGEKVDSFAEELAQSKTSLRKVLKYRMQVRTHCQKINYAYAFMGLRTIGQNISSFKAKTGTQKNPIFVNLEDVEITRSEKYKERLSRPNGPLP